MDTGKGETVKELISVLPNTLMQMSNVGIYRHFVSGAGKASSSNTQKDIENTNV